MSGIPEEKIRADFEIKERSPEEEFRRWEEASRRAMAIKILDQAERYVRGYLRDYAIKTYTNFKKNPLRLVIEVDASLPEEEEEEESEKVEEVSER